MLCRNTSTANFQGQGGEMICTSSHPVLHEDMSQSIDVASADL